MHSLAQTLIVAVTLSLCLGDESSEELAGPLLSTFKGVQHEVEHGSNGVYKFFFTLPQQERAEERDSYGKVIGSFAFVDPYGEEVALNFDAGEHGYLPQSDHLPQAPVYTDEVQQARQDFLASYQRVAEYLDDLHSDEDDDDDSLSDESLEDDSEEESSEESSEEDSEEDEDDE